MMMVQEMPSIFPLTLLKLSCKHVNPIMILQSKKIYFAIFTVIIQRSNLKMSQQRNFQSLPKKAQPTLSSSNKCQTTATSKFVCRQVQGCPEISQFKGEKMEQLYIHHLQIDYGRLERPNYFYFNGPKYQQVAKMTDNMNDFQLNEQMSTKRFTGISSLAAQSNLQERNTQKKNNRFQYLNQKTQESSRPSTITKNTKVKIKLAEVKAYQQLTKREPSVKRLHSRIVRMMVGGGKVTTKVITYPDNGDYLKLAGLR